MNKNFATDLVKNTFEQGFDRDRFYRFIKELLNKLDESKAFHAHGYVKEKFKETTKIVKTYERLGTYIDPEGNKIDILIVYLEKKNSLDRARTTLRNFVADYLRQRDMKEAALVAFVSPDLNDWRFSLVKMEYKISKTPSGNMKAKEELTPAKRFSFLVGPEEHTHTAQSRLAPIIQDDVNNPTLEELEDVFNIEKVTKEFFEKYKKLFLDTKEALDAIVTKDTKIKADFQEKNIDTTDFSKKLLGQIVFLYFLQKKGWFGVGRDDNWGTGPKNFLRLLFEKMIADYKNFFNDILEPLFYEALAKERDKDFYSRFNCKIPFLNGGLFDPISDYDWVHTDILLPDDLFSNHVRTKEGDIGTGILDIFDRYNFTVKEDEPLEKEVAVDPEMLGKVFENLLEVKDRKSKGTYYTPREIVHYMCQESLINYLVNECEGKVNREDIETLIQYGETAVEHDSRVEQEGKETETYSYKLPESIRKNAQLLDDKLKNIRVCDPAIGSGAFPVGMMNEIVRTRNTLTSYLSLRGAEATKQSRSTYNFKRHAIQNSLYGVDIDPGAVEIAKLRLWLSLVVDEQDIKQIKPLPNLDYKIMQGNSLLEEYEGIKLFDEGIVSASPLDNTKQIEEIKQKLSELQREFIKLHSAGELRGVKKQQIEAELKKYNDWLNKLTKAPKVKADNGSLFDQFSQAKQKSDELKKLHQEFFETANKREKDEIKKKIEVLEWELIEATLREQNKLSLLPEIERFKKANIKPFFLWKLNFSEVFEKADGKAGFDVVITNPPYVRVQNLSYEEIDSYKRIYRSAYKRLDLSILFLELSLKIMNSTGLTVYITSSQFTKTEYGRKIRELLTGYLESIVYFGDNQMFESATNYTSLFFLRKNTKETTVKYSNAEKYSGTPGLNEYILDKQTFLNREDLGERPWELENSDLISVLNKIKNPGYKNLDDIADIEYGLVTGADSVFVLRKGNNSLKNAGFVYPLLRPSDTDRYRINTPLNYVIYPYKEVDNDTVLVDEDTLKSISPEVYSYLLENKKSLLKRKDSRTDVNENKRLWYSLMRHSSFQKVKKEKILTQALCTHNEFCLDVEGNFFTGGSIYSACTKSETITNKSLLGLLNSRLCEFYYQLVCPIRQHGYRFYAGTFLKTFPIATGFYEEMNVLNVLVEKILSLSTSNDFLQNLSMQKSVHEYEKQIDQLVYKLYGLTPEEIAIVEGEQIWLKVKKL